MTKTKLVSLDKKKYMRDWRKKHPNYFTKYYKLNSKTIIDNVKRYMHSKKGSVTTAKYEASTQRKKNKVEYQQRLRRKLKRGVVQVA